MRGGKACLAKLLAEAGEEIAAWERGERPELRTVSYYTYDDGTVERVDKQGNHVVREIIPPRAGWDQSFARMAAEGDDRLLDADTATSSWDDEEWEWPPDP